MGKKEVAGHFCFQSKLFCAMLAIPALLCGAVTELPITETASMPSLDGMMQMIAGLEEATNPSHSSGMPQQAFGFPSASSGTFEMIVEDSQGNQFEVKSGPGASAEMAFSTFFREALPFDLSSVLTEISNVLSEDYPEPSPSPAPAAVVEERGHPCEAEINACLQIGASTRSEIEQCLVTNQEQLSSSCKCFLHQILPSEVAKQLASPAASEPAMATIAVVDFEVEPAPEMRTHGACGFMALLFMISFVLLVRHCCICFCKPKPQFEAVVMPEVTTIKTLQPLVAAPIKTTV